MTVYLEQLAADLGNWPYRRAVSIAMLDAWLEYLEERAFVDGNLAESLRSNLEKRLAPQVDEIGQRIGDRRLTESVREKWESVYE